VAACRASVPYQRSYLACLRGSLMQIKQPEGLTINSEELAGLTRHELTDHLERGGVVIFPTAPAELPSDEDIRFLREETPDLHLRKNISYYPEAHRIDGMGGSIEQLQRTLQILRDYHDRVEKFLTGVIPSFADGWTSATASLRVFQEKDRDIPLHARSDRLHLDAGTYGASKGDLILRFITNLDDVDRVWKCKGTAPDLIERFGDAAGIERRPDLLTDSIMNRIGSTLIDGTAKVFPMARVLGQSSYDRAMRRMHNYMKESEEFHTDPEGMVEIHFKPKSCWLVFADMAGHSCKSGSFALINTFMVPRQNFRQPQYSPWEVLRHFSMGEPTLPGPDPR
jgi:3-deoxy-D-manno-oct-2-ulosonic acid (Kdo) hydroxylase